MSQVNFDYIPQALRVPGVQIEFNNNRAGSSQIIKKVLLVGLMTASATVAANNVVPINDKEEGFTLFGERSPLAMMCNQFKKNNWQLDCYAAGIPEDGAGVAAEWTLQITAAPTAASTFTVYIAGIPIKIAVATTQTADDVATALEAAISAHSRVPVTVSRLTDTLTLTAAYKGAIGNDIDIRTDLNGETPKVASTLTQTVTGATNPDIDTLITALGDTQYHYFVLGLNDSVNIDALTVELDSRYQPPRQIGGRAFIGYRNDFNNSKTFTQGFNSPHLTCMPSGLAAHPPWEWAAVDAAIASQFLANDPARPLQELALPGLIAPKTTWTYAQRNDILFNGSATYTVRNDGTVQIERQITTYQTNPAGFADSSYLDIQVPETLEEIRRLQIFEASQRFQRYKLAEKSEEFGAGQKILDPDKFKAFLITFYRETLLAEKGWVQDADNYKATIQVFINAEDKNRIDYIDQPTLIGQLRIIAGQTQFA